MQHALEIEKKRIPTLDGVRGIAILMVMVFHYTREIYPKHTSPFADRIFLWLCDSGWLGVDLFFVISGFLITGILLDTVDTKKYFMTFYTRRFLRIFPIYYLILAIMIFIGPIILHGDFNLQSLMDNRIWLWTYLTNWRIAWLGSFNSIDAGYLWSLAVEEQFYLIWPFMIYLSKGKMTVPCIALIIIGVVMRPFLYHMGVSADALYVMTFTHSDGLLVGSLLLILLKGPKSRLTQKYTKYAAISMVLVGMLLTLYSGRLLFWLTPIAVYGGLPFAIIFAYFVLSAVLASDGTMLYEILTNKTLRLFGKYSYFIYLVHLPIGLLVARFLYDPSSKIVYGSIIPPVITYIILSGILCLMLGYISWSIFERRILYLKKYFQYG